MSPRRPPSQVYAHDGLIAGDSGEWAKDKLEFLEHYGPVAVQATQAKRSRHFVDLFAGPGINVRRGGTEEFDGSPLRALEIVSADGTVSFTHAAFFNRGQREHQALAARIAARTAAGRCRIPPSQISTYEGDCNALIGGVMDAIHPNAYVFAFADPYSPKQLPWVTLERLRRDHESVDLYALFPLDMALKRLISINPRTVEEATPTLTAFFGTGAWREVIPKRRVPGDGQEIGRALLQLYLARLGTLWKYRDTICEVKRGQSHRLYHMLFASNNAGGRDISKWAKRRSTSQHQLSL